MHLSIWLTVYFAAHLLEPPGIMHLALTRLNSGTSVMMERPVIYLTFFRTLSQQQQCHGPQGLRLAACKPLT